MPAPTEPKVSTSVPGHPGRALPGVPSAPGGAPAEAARGTGPDRARFVDRHLPYLLARASHALWRGFEPKVRAAGLNSLEWRVLATLSDSEPMAVGALALEVLAKQPTLTKSLDRLAGQGWVERQPDPQDARRARVRLTPAGRAKVAPLLAAAEQHQRDRLAALGVQAPEGLQAALAALLRSGAAG